MKQPSILIVEDNKIMRTMIRLTLEAEGYTVLEAETGAQALAQMVASPDLVLQDLGLPDVDGLLLVEQLRALPSGADIPVLAFSGFLSKMEGLQARGDGFTGFVSKPVEPSRLVEIVRSYVPLLGATDARPGEGRSCLLVDDDQVQLKLLATRLGRAGFRVRTAHDGDEALDAARRAPPDVVVSDVLMPRMDGFELCIALRQDPRLADVPVVLTMVAYTEGLDEELARAAGADAYAVRAPDGQAVVEAALASLRNDRPRLGPKAPKLPIAQYAHRIVRQLERQAALNQSLTRRLGWLDAELSVLSGVADSLTAGAPTDTILDELLYRCLDASGASAGVAYLREADGQHHARATFGGARQTDGIVRALQLPSLASRLRDGSVLMPSRDFQGHQIDRLLEAAEAASIVVAPITLDHEQVGVLVMASNTRGFGEDWLAFAGVVGRQIGQAVGLVRALSQVRGEQERLGRIVETVPDGIVIVGMDDEIRFVNVAAARIFGRSMVELIEHRGDELDWQMTDVEGRPIPASERLTAQVPRTGVPAYGVERVVTRPDGSRVFLSMNAAPLHDPDGTMIGTVLALTDVTERRRHQEALRESEQRFRRMVETAQEGVWEIDADSRTTFANQKMAAMLGITVEEMRGVPVFSFIDDEWQAVAVAAMKQGVRGSAQRVEVKFRRKDGGDLWAIVATNPIYDSTGEYSGSLALVTDITDRKHAEQALAYRESQLAEAQRLAHLGSWEWEIATNRLLWSDEHYRILGREPKGLSPTLDDALAVVHPEDVELVRSSLDAAVRMGTPHDCHLRIVRPGGEVRTIHCRGTIVRDALGRPERMMGTAQDITERRQAEIERERLLASEQAALAELQATQQRVVQQERLRAMGEMSSGIAHDFNNALSIVLGYSDLLLADPSIVADVDRVRQSVLAINVAAQDAAVVVGRLREFYRQRDSGEAHIPVNLASIVNETIEITRPRWKDAAQAKGATIAVQTAIESTPSILGDPSELREVLVNLIINAVDAMPNGGMLTIGTRETRGQAVLEVTDTGIGMPEETLRHCLEPFYTTKGEHGTGLGLAMVYGVVQRHRGSVEIASEQGRGTHITLWFPTVGHDASTPVATLKELLPNRPLNILLVDDYPQVRALLSTALLSDGHTVEQAVDGTDALAKFQAGDFDLVITDHAMPEMSGEQLAYRLKQQAVDTPVILLTGFGDMINAAGERPPGVDLVVGKPVTLSRLRQAVSEVCGSAPLNRG